MSVGKNSNAILLIIALTALGWALLSPGQTTTGPATHPDASIATQPAQIEPVAQTMLDGMRDAYARLNSLKLVGTLALELEAADQKQSNRSEFTGSFLAPNRFRHEMEDDALIVCTEDKAYLYLPASARYAQTDAPGGRSASAGLTEPLESVLRQQNLSLYLTMCEDAARELVDGAKSVQAGTDADIGGTKYLRLTIERKDEDLTLWIDPVTKLIRRAQIDLRRSLESQQVPEVKTALVTIDYTETSVNPPLAKAAFAWSPPANATEARGGESAAMAGASSEALKGRQAPDFTLKDLKDTPVALVALRGSVVVLDFWATWCGPCRAAMPHLDKLHQDLGERGVKVLAVNLKESKQVASKYVEDNHLTMRVVLDADGKVAEKYAVSGIPQTVVIGKNGVVQDVIIGFGPGGEQRLRQAVERALAAE